MFKRKLINAEDEDEPLGQDSVFDEVTNKILSEYHSN